MADKKVTKSFTQKGINGETYYFGTDGQLVDMLSGLNLQEQLKFGTPERIVIQDQEDSFKVIQYFFDLNGDPTYSVVTDINNSVNEWVLNNPTTIITSFQTDGLISQSNEPSSIEADTGYYITIILYKGTYSTVSGATNEQLYRRFVNLEEDISGGE